MKPNSRRQLRVESLESKTLLAADMAAIAEAYVEPFSQENSPPPLLAGDANIDGRFDSIDLLDVFRAGRYMTGQPADWSEGDWNGDNLFDSNDLVLAFQSGNYVSAEVAAKPAQTSSANTVRLDPGSDGLAAAIDAAGPRGTVILAAGTHTESSSVVITQPVTILGEEGAVVEFNTTAPAALPLVVDAGFHIMDTRHVQIRGLDIRPADDVGGMAILVEDSEHVRIEHNTITDFHTSILVESADHSTIAENVINTTPAPLPFTTGINVVNGFGNHVLGNSAQGGFLGIFASGANGKLFGNNTSYNFIGVILCKNAEGTFVMPDGTPSGSLISATRWLVQGNTATNNLNAGYLVIDGANNNVLTNNMARDNGTYDIEITGDSLRFGFLTPFAFNNIVNVGPHKGITIKDCGVDSKVHGGDLVDTGADPCEEI